ncbi:ATPase, V1 complex, subunit C [Trametopsis cervina]|nr:ATPase, V1 complex, subunit C [Trametopsis cervina]
MPSDQSTWLISIPQDGDSDGYFQELHSKLAAQSKTAPSLSELAIPTFKTGTLDGLIALSEDLPKQDTFFTATVAKTVDTIRNLLNNDPAKLVQHLLVNERPVDDYLLNGWKWNEGRYGTQRGLREMLDALIKEMSSIDNVMKTKLQNYNLAKGSLQQMQRKKTGNLSVRSLVDIVKKEHFVDQSEYMETQVVAVPNALAKEWTSKYEKLTAFVVPRSSVQITSDEEYTLFAVVIFKRVHDEFVQKCRENKFIVRDFHFSEDEIEKQKEELSAADTTEKELWTELLQVSRTNFSEAFQILVHLKVLHIFVESVLRYGLPASYTGCIIKPEPKSIKRTLATLQTQFAYLARRSNRASDKNPKTQNTEEFVGEYQALLDQEFFDFVLFEVPWITL